MNAQNYFNKNPEWNIYLKIFFDMCRKYNINYSSASEVDRFFVAEVTRVNYELDRCRRLGLSTSSVRPSFE